MRLSYGIETTNKIRYGRANAYSLYYVSFGAMFDSIARVG